MLALLSLGALAGPDDELYHVFNDAFILQHPCLRRGYGCVALFGNSCDTLPFLEIL